MTKKKIVAPFLKPIAILSISVGIGATTAVVDSQSYKPPKQPKTEITTEPSDNSVNEDNNKKQEPSTTESTTSIINKDERKLPNKKEDTLSTTDDTTNDDPIGNEDNTPISPNQEDTEKPTNGSPNKGDQDNVKPDAPNDKTPTAENPSKNKQEGGTP